MARESAASPVSLGNCHREKINKPHFLAPFKVVLKVALLKHWYFTTFLTKFGIQIDTIE